jgi:hypothetical protein
MKGTICGKVYYVRTLKPLTNHSSTQAGHLPKTESSTLRIWPNKRRSPDCIQIINIGLAIPIGDNATASIVRGRDDRDGLPGDIDAEFQAAFVDGGKVLLQEVGSFC